MHRMLFSAGKIFSQMSRSSMSSRVLKQSVQRNAFRMTGSFRLQNLNYILQGSDLDMMDLSQVQEDEEMLASSLVLSQRITT